MITFSRARIEMRHFYIEIGGYISLPFGYVYWSYRAENLGQARTTSRLTTLKFLRSNSNPTPVFQSHFDLKIWNSKWQENLEIENFHWKVNINFSKRSRIFRGKIRHFSKIVYWLGSPIGKKWKMCIKLWKVKIFSQKVDKLRQKKSTM